MSLHPDPYVYNRKPLGDPKPQASNLALAIVLLVVLAIQAVFNAWQGETNVLSLHALHYPHLEKTTPPAESWLPLLACCLLMFS
jgi:hypothetical protein